MNTQPHIGTERLTLRPPTRDDIDALHCLWTDPDVRRDLSDDQIIPKEHTTQELHKTIDCFTTHGLGLWAVCLKNHTQLIGVCGFLAEGNPREAELLYTITLSYWKQDLITAATKAVLQYGLESLGFERIVANIDVPHVGSIRVMEKIEMQFDRQEQVDGLELGFYSIGREGSASEETA